MFVLCSVSLAIKKTKEELHQSINTFNKQLARFPSLIAVTIPPTLGLCSLCILLELFFLPKAAASIRELWSGPQKTYWYYLPLSHTPTWVYTLRNLSSMDVWEAIAIWACSISNTDIFKIPWSRTLALGIGETILICLDVFFLFFLHLHLYHICTW